MIDGNKKEVHCIRELEKNEVLDLLSAYDAYVTTAFDAMLPETGWVPVCVSEFYENEYQNVWFAGENFDYMYGLDSVEVEVSDVRLDDARDPLGVARSASIDQQRRASSSAEQTRGSMETAR